MGRSKLSRQASDAGRRRFRRYEYLDGRRTIVFGSAALQIEMVAALSRARHRPIGTIGHIDDERVIRDPAEGEYARKAGFHVC